MTHQFIFKLEFFFLAIFYAFIYGEYLEFSHIMHEDKWYRKNGMKCVSSNAPHAQKEKSSSCWRFYSFECFRFYCGNFYFLCLSKVFVSNMHYFHIKSTCLSAHRMFKRKFGKFLLIAISKMCVSSIISFRFLKIENSVLSVRKLFLCLKVLNGLILCILIVSCVELSFDSIKHWI